MIQSAMRVCDVFLAHVPDDAVVAETLVRDFERSGLSVFPRDEEERDPRLAMTEDYREAIAEARAFIAIVSPASVDAPALLFHAGAASSWAIPIFILLRGIKRSRVPAALRKYPTFLLSERSKLVMEVKKGFTVLTSEQQETLRQTYLKVGIKPDDLPERWDALESLAKRFNRKARVKLSPERLLQELLRLRREQELPALRS